MSREGLDVNACLLDRGTELPRRYVSEWALRVRNDAAFQRGRRLTMEVCRDASKGAGP
jgi:hypothetical protein